MKNQIRNQWWEESRYGLLASTASPFVFEHPLHSLEFAVVLGVRRCETANREPSATLLWHYVAFVVVNQNHSFKTNAWDHGQVFLSAAPPDALYILKPGGSGAFRYKVRCDLSHLGLRDRCVEHEARDCL
jgi:hypothetical protein